MRYYRYDFNNNIYYFKVTSKDKIEIMLRHNKYSNIGIHFKAIDSFKKNIDKAELVSLKIFNFELKKNRMVRELSK